MKTKHELSIVALSPSESHTGKFALILESVDSHKRIPLIIGQTEAQAIAIAMEHMQPARPLSHDVIKNLLELFDAHPVEVLIHSILDGVFHTSLLLKKNDGTTAEIDLRTSDAIALAVRSNTPIFIYEHLIEEAGFLTQNFVPNQRKGSLAEYSIFELEDLLQKVLEKEDYKSAVRLRDYIEKRKS